MTGALRIEPLPWDSEFFGRRIGRLRPEAPLDRVTPETIDRSAFDCIYVELDAAGPYDLDSWERVGARLIDTRVELAAALDGLPLSSDRSAAIEEVRTWSERDRSAARELAADLSRWSRFGLDPAFSGRAAAMYDRWIGQAFEGAHRTLVWRESGQIAGLLTFEIDGATAWIELLVVHHRYRGHGIGLALVRTFLTVARDAAASTARVRTQLRNSGAIVTYERAGLAVDRTTKVLHWWSERS